MHKICSAVLALLCLPLISISQNDRHDKGSFINYENQYYNRIKKDLYRYNYPKGEPRQAYKMDFSEVDLPKSVDEFTTVWCQEPISQGRTGTCWCFSTSSFFESEVHRMHGVDLKLSELYIVYWEYVEKARHYVQTRGESFFGEGSETNAVTRMMDNYGMVPWSVYNGLQDGQPFHDHKAMFDEMEHYLQSIKRDNAWNEEVVLGNIKAILNHYIGAPPTEFKWENKTITPKEFLKDVMKLNPKDYVNFMSLLEKPFFEKAEYDVPDNWWDSEEYYNVPLDEFMDMIKQSLKDGYSLAIGGDVSESGYSSHHDVAMIPSYDIPSEYIDDHARQLRFSNGSTTDDHAIHLVGYLEKDKDFWFLIKDSGSGARNGKNEGYYFYHEDYVKLKMMNFTVHREAVEKVLAKMK